MDLIAKHSNEVKQNFYKDIISSMNEGLIVVDYKGIIITANQAFCNMTGFSLSELIGEKPPYPYWDLDHLKEIEKEFEHTMSGEFNEIETWFRKKSGKKFPVLCFPSSINIGNCCFYAIFTDISKIKHLEQKLIKANRICKKNVKIRTIELEQTKIALNVVIQNMQNEQNKIEQKILKNIKLSINPLFYRLRQTTLSDEQEYLVKDIEKKIGEILSPLMKKITDKFPNLTLKEIDILNMIREGRASKEIADILHVSYETISFHRKNIRKKLGIINKNIRIREFVNSV